MMQISLVYQQRRRRVRFVRSCNRTSSSLHSSKSYWSQQTVPLFVVLLLLFTNTAQAYSTGAGSCKGGDVAPVGGFHLELTNPDGSDRFVQSGALSEGMVSVLINDNMNDPLVEDAPYVLQTQTSYTLTIVTTQDPGYKGILIRFSNNDNTVDVPNDVLLQPTDSLLQLAMACNSETNTIGLTHTSKSEKLSVTTDLTFNAPGTILLDISIVGVNDDVASLYGHTAFLLQIEGDAATDSPTRTPTTSPTLTAGTTARPTISPTMDDFLIDTLSPTFQVQSPSAPSSGSNNNETRTSDATVSSSRYNTIVVLVMGWSVTFLLL